jgi:predicted nucleotidyltransferase
MADNVIYETIMGSYTYGVATETSDFDTMGVCIPPKELVFPHLTGAIEGFGRQKQRFTCYQKHHVKICDRVYDLNVYNIVHYFHLCMENNPNMIASLFTPQDCVLHCTQVGNLIREKRHLFIHKGCWHRFKGYAYSQLHKIRTSVAEAGGNRAQIIEQYGWDTKFGYHVVRLLDEVEQLLSTGDLDLRRNAAQLKAIRRGEINMEELFIWATEKEKSLERLYETSKLPYGPDEKAIKEVLLNCLEMHWGSLDKIVREDAAEQVVRDIQAILDNYNPR